MRIKECYLEYLVAQITMDFAAAEKAWCNMSDEAHETFNKLMLGLDKYRGKHVEAPMGSTWKVHESLISRVEKIAQEYLDDFANALLSNADTLDFIC